MSRLNYNFNVLISNVKHCTRAVLSLSFIMYVHVQPFPARVYNLYIAVGADVVQTIYIYISIYSYVIVACRIS